MTRRRSIVLAGVASVLPWAPALADDGTPARADAARKYGAVSMVGDHLTIVTHRPVTGSSLDRNDHEAVPVESTELDDAALLAIKRALSSRAVDPAYYRFDRAGDAASVLDGDAVRFPPALAQGLARDGITDLVMVTPFRGPAQLHERTGHVGSGNLEGLGFYLDATYRMRRGDTGERARGFIAPYVYVQVSLVDVATARVLKRQVVERGEVVSAARNPDDTDAWGALTPQAKVRWIKNMLGREVMRSTAELVGG